MHTPGTSKEEYVERLFSSIAARYDLLNSILSFNCHKRWRRFAVGKCCLTHGNNAVDVAAGTLDFSFELSKVVGSTGQVTAVDFCLPMLEIGMAKLRRSKIGNISVLQGNAEHLPLPSDTFDAATIGFALRNVSSVENAVNEMTRVVKSGGRVVSLELAKPEGRIFRHIYNIYFYKLLPFIGGVINGKKEPYAYLPASLTRFCTREELAQIMKNAGLADIQVYNLTGGIVTVHVGTKI
ncbi:MAG: bifunctional demethylmenaquinone methyltransferase/2-methoxy-6-polyprenyl-1,4-benzoquinol methylase UbiE [Armatimonadota bacterium]